MVGLELTALLNSTLTSVSFTPSEVGLCIPCSRSLNVAISFVGILDCSSMTTVTAADGVDLSRVLRANSTGSMLLVSGSFAQPAFVVGVADGLTTALPIVAKRPGWNDSVDWWWWKDRVAVDCAHAASITLISPLDLDEETTTASVDEIRASREGPANYSIVGHGGLMADDAGVHDDEIRVVRKDMRKIVGSNGSFGRPRTVAGETTEGDCLIRFGGRHQSIYLVNLIGPLRYLC